MPRNTRISREGRLVWIQTNFKLFLTCSFRLGVAISSWFHLPSSRFHPDFKVIWKPMQAEFKLVSNLVETCFQTEFKLISKWFDIDCKQNSKLSQTELKVVSEWIQTELIQDAANIMHRQTSAFRFQCEKEVTSSVRERTEHDAKLATAGYTRTYFLTGFPNIAGQGQHPLRTKQHRVDSHDGRHSSRVQPNDTHEWVDPIDSMEYILCDT